MLELRHLTIAYPGQEPVIRDISLSVNKGEILMLIGTNGTGKTTLIRGLSGVLPPQSGEILWGGKSLAALPPRDRARLVAVVPQAAETARGYTVFETVSHGRTPYLNWFGKLSDRDRAVITEAIRRTELEELAQTEVGQLSGGQLQRVIIARALAQEAPVLLLDEPTTFLDLHYQLSLLQLVRELCREKQLCVVMILHDLNLAARFADRVALLDGGSLAAIGTPADVMTESRLSALYRTPIRILRDPQEGLIVIPGISEGINLERK